MKTYEGMRTPTGARVYVLDHDRRHKRDLPPRQDLRNHSPDGFEWGYQGSGPAQLALALCADVLGDDDRANSVYQLVKCELVAPIHTDRWTISEEELRAAIERAEGEQ